MPKEKSEAEGWLETIGVLIVIGVLIYAFIIQPLTVGVQQTITWFQQNIVIIGVGALCIAGLVVGKSILDRRWREEESQRQLEILAQQREKKEHERRMSEARAQLSRTQFEEQQTTLGRVRFVDRFEKERWGTPAEVGTWKKEDEEARREKRSSELQKILEELLEYRPLKPYAKESELENSIVSWLSRTHRIRTQQAYERTKIDAVIGRIGIEIKLNPDESEYDRLFGQIQKYLKHLDYVIAVVGHERSKESTEGFKDRLKDMGWLDKRVFLVRV